MSVAEAFHYATLDIVKQKLRIQESDHTIDEELETYSTEVDTLINRHLRRKLGTFDQNGDPINLPLTETTYPAITEDLRVIADDLVEGKFRLKTTNDEILWNNAKQQLLEYLDFEFGWTENKPFRRTPDISITPTTGIPDTTVTVAGSNFANIETLEIVFGGVLQDTTPAEVVTTSSGAIPASVTFDVPTNAGKGAKEVKVRSISGTVDPTAKNLPLKNVGITRFEVT